jgi:hypothetical protein
MNEFEHLAEMARHHHVDDLLGLSVHLAGTACSPLYQRHVSPEPRTRRPHSGAHRPVAAGRLEDSHAAAKCSWQQALWSQSALVARSVQSAS